MLTKFLGNDGHPIGHAHHGPRAKLLPVRVTDHFLLNLLTVFHPNIIVIAHIYYGPLASCSRAH